jgi:hypothetical protein
VGLDLNRRLGWSWCLPLLSLSLSLSLLFQCPDLGLHQLLLLRGHPSATLAELVLKSGSYSLLLRDVHLTSDLRHRLSNPIGELEGSTVDRGSLDKL